MRWGGVQGGQSPVCVPTVRAKLLLNLQMEAKFADCQKRSGVLPWVAYFRVPPRHLQENPGERRFRGAVEAPARGVGDDCRRNDVTLELEAGCRGGVVRQKSLRRVRNGGGDVRQSLLRS